MTNQITIEGNVTANLAEPRTFGDGTPVVNFDVADSINYRDNDGNYQSTEPIFWHIEVTGNMAKVAAGRLTKGSPVIVTGRIRPNEYTDNDGHRVKQLRVRATALGDSLRYDRTRQGESQLTDQ